MKFSIKQHSILISSFFLCALLLLGLFVFDGLQPFGPKSLVTVDANIQYLDFFAYYKDTLAGNNSFLYSFSKTLGGNCIAIFSYYLASPFTILYAIFPPSSYYALFNIIFLLKVSLAALTMSLFLQYRFSDEERELSPYFIIILSLSYALSQYTIAQSSNTMWLDGVYMLPVLMMQITRFVRKEYIIGIPVAVGVSILFNWYSAGMNSLFALVWFIHEYCTEKGITGIVKHSVVFLGLMLLGVGLSAVLFLPTAMAFGSGNRGSLQLGLLLEPDFYGNVLSVLKNYYPGVVSTIGSPALYFGIIPLIACVSLFLCKSTGKKGSLFLLVFMVLMLFWNPLMMAFSLLKSVTSYWYRYGYICIFILLFIACNYSSHHQNNDWRIPLLSSILLALIYPFCWFNQITTHIPLILGNMCVFVLGGVLLSLFVRYAGKYRHAGVWLILLCAADLLYNVHILAVQVYSSDDHSYAQYSAEERMGISAVKQNDTGNYRISETSTRLMYEDGTTSSYNDALAYNYYSISGYTSSPDDIQRDFLAKLGYRKNGENYNIVNTSIISADSLLGVKYVLSPYDIYGLEKTDNTTYYGKYIYRNSFVLPMSFMYTGNECIPDDTNPFLYQNDLYQQLTGRSEDIYKPAEYFYSQTEDTIDITVYLPEGNYSLYGNLPWKKRGYLSLSVNNAYTIGYAAWGSQSVFYIPCDGNTAEIQMSLNNIDPDNYTLQFYALDLDLLGEYTSLLNQHPVQNMTLENGHVQITADAQKGQELYISVPYDPGWEVTLNGHPAEYTLFGDCMYSILLEEGLNQIDMQYHVPGLMPGLLCTAGSLCILLVINIITKRKKLRV